MKREAILITLTIIFTMASVFILFTDKYNHVSHMSCTAEYYVSTKEANLFSSFNITQKNNKGVILMVGDYAELSGKTIQVRISKPFTYMQYENIYHTNSASISVFPQDISTNFDFISMLPMFLMSETSEVSYSAVPLGNGDIIIQQGNSPVLYCESNI
ncbi:hypothetical protein ACISK3_11890 [Morganella morganii]|nr:hypothetical protein [Morganella morganii]